MIYSKPQKTLTNCYLRLMIMASEWLLVWFSLYMFVSCPFSITVYPNCRCVLVFSICSPCYHTTQNHWSDPGGISAPLAGSSPSICLRPSWIAVLLLRSPPGRISMIFATPGVENHGSLNFEENLLMKLLIFQSMLRRLIDFHATNSSQPCLDLIGGYSTAVKTQVHSRCCQTWTE